jgi:hypothetical protein
LTAFRLVERARHKKLGADDAWAAFAMCAVILLMIILELHVEPQTASLPRTTLIGFYYIMSQSFYAIIWACRLSIIASLRRIVTTGTMNKVLLYAMYAFLITWGILFAQVFWTCENEPGWKDTPAPFCALGQKVGIAQVITDVGADIFLVVSPLHIFWKSRLSRRDRFRLSAVFAATVATTVTSLNHAYNLLKFGGLEEAFSAVIETSVSLFVCNLPVIIGVIMRFTNGKEDDSRNQTSGPSSNTIPLSGRFQNSQKPRGNTTFAISMDEGELDPSASKAELRRDDLEANSFSYAQKGAWTNQTSNGAGVYVTRETQQY